MALILDGLVEAESWTDLWDGDVSAVPVGDLPLSDPKCQYIRIPSPQSCPILVEQAVLVFEASSIHARDHWTTAGYINQLIPTRVEGGDQPKYQAYRKRVTLGNPQLLFLPVLGRGSITASKIELIVPKWLKHIKWKMWGYTGQISSSELVEIARVRETQLTIIQSLQQISYQLNLIDQNINNV